MPILLRSEIWVLTALALLAGMVLALALGRAEVVSNARRVAPVLTFLVVYLALLIITATASAYDRLDWRFLALAHVPLVIVVLSFSRAGLARVPPAWKRSAYLTLTGVVGFCGIWSGVYSAVMVFRAIVAPQLPG